MSNPELARALGRRLRELADRPVLHKGDLKGWYSAAREVDAWVRANAAAIDHLPHFYWHYLSDADTRLKDHEYRRVQDEAVRELIECLEAGRFPALRGDE